MNRTGGENPQAAPVPAFSELLATFGWIGATSFGGPAGQIAMMHRVLVDEKRWLDEKTYLTALSFCTLLPGPEAMQLATYSGWRLHGTRGGLAAGLLFVLPGAIIILALSLIYAFYGQLPAVSALFLGIKAAVLAIVLEALLRISRKSLKDNTEWAIAALAFAAIFFFHVPFPLIVLAAGLFGYWRGAGRAAAQAAPAVHVTVPFSATLRTVGVWLAIWIAPLAALALLFGPTHTLSKLAWFFSKLAVVTFGGAYAVLAYVAQDAVDVYGWLKPGEMLDGLGLAETTPGPLILVNQFVGFLAAFRQVGGVPVAMGIAGAIVVLWATFAPCFLWIFAGAPYVERIATMPKLKSALSAITAAVVGVVLNLTVWFALHVLFRTVTEIEVWPLHLTVPDIASLDKLAAGLAALAALMLFRLHAGIAATLVLCGALGLAAMWLP